MSSCSASSPSWCRRPGRGWRWPGAAGASWLLFLRSDNVVWDTGQNVASSDLILSVFALTNTSRPTVALFAGEQRMLWQGETYRTELRITVSTLFGSSSQHKIFILEKYFQPFLVSPNSRPNDPRAEFCANWLEAINWKISHKSSLLRYLWEIFGLDKHHWYKRFSSKFLLPWGS